ncbi:hypothetical protein TNCV_3749541 [Trichonephila clavipes]|nr:hypothetical protein TNCV_3749541 [Trichonephila clavipes]
MLSLEKMARGSITIRQQQSRRQRIVVFKFFYYRYVSPLPGSETQAMNYSRSILHVDPNSYTRRRIGSVRIERQQCSTQEDLLYTRNCITGGLACLLFCQWFAK